MVISSAFILLATLLGGLVGFTFGGLFTYMIVFEALDNIGRKRKRR